MDQKIELGPVEQTILRRLRNGPVHCRSFTVVKAVVNRLIRYGLIRRVKGPANPGLMYVELTASGETLMNPPKESLSRTILEKAVSVKEKPNDQG